MTMIRRLAVAALLAAGGCGGTDEPAVDRDALCAAECSDGASRGGYDPAMFASAYCPGFCGGAGECRCLPAAWTLGHSVCEASEAIVCPWR